MSHPQKVLYSDSFCTWQRVPAELLMVRERVDPLIRILRLDIMSLQGRRAYRETCWLRQEMKGSSLVPEPL